MPRVKEQKRNDGYYEYKCVVGKNFDGSAVYKSFYSKKSKADARKKAENFMISKSQEIEPEQMTFQTFSEPFLKAAETRVKKTTYRNSYCTYFYKHYLPYFGDCLLSEIKKSDVEAFVIEKQNELALATVKNLMRLLSSFFNDAVDNGYMKSNPCRNIRLKPDKKKFKNVYTPDQVDKVLEYCKQDPFGLNIHIMLSYGMSVSEFLGITIDDVNFEDLTISINKSAVYAKGEMLVGETKNIHRNRVIAISKETADWIKREAKHKYISNNSNDKVLPVFMFRYRYSMFMRRMQAYYFKQNVIIPYLNPHELRHTRASTWVNEGKNLFAIAEMMGWSDLSMLRKVYAHPDIQELRKSLNL